MARSRHQKPQEIDNTGEQIHLKLNKNEAMMIAQLFGTMNMLMIANPAKYSMTVMSQLQFVMDQLDYLIHLVKWCDNPDCSYQIKEDPLVKQAKKSKDEPKN